jgi:uncharacterized membrane protein YkgB
MQGNDGRDLRWKRLDRFEGRLTRWSARYGIPALRISLGVVFLWFGALKFLPGLSPAEDLAARTIRDLSPNSIGPRVAVTILAVWECLIGLGLIARVWMRATLLLLSLQMVGALAPLFLYPGEMFTRVPYAPSLEGQYIIKNIVLISAGLVLAATVRGGDLIADPERLSDGSSA